MPPKRTVYLSGLEEGGVYRVKTEACEYWLIMTGAPLTAEVWLCPDGQWEAKIMGASIFPKRIAEGEPCAIKDLNGTMRILIIPTEISASSIEEIPVHIPA